MSDSLLTHARKGREGKGVGREWKQPIHASRLTSANSLPVDNANEVTTQPRLGWMDLRWIGGGW